MSSIETPVLFSVSLLVLAGVARMRSREITLAGPCTVALAMCSFVVIVWANLRGAPMSEAAVMTLACAVVCAASDLATGLIFDQVVAATAIAIVLDSLVSWNMSMAAVGACSSAGSMLVLYAATQGRGIGLGDVKLSAVIGGGLGGVLSVGAVGAAFVAGALWAAPLLVSRRARRGDRLAFAPFLAVGAIACAALRW